jgi:hypothetical protein
VEQSRILCSYLYSRGKRIQFFRYVHVVDVVRYRPSCCYRIAYIRGVPGRDPGYLPTFEVFAAVKMHVEVFLVVALCNVVVV